MTDRIHLSAPDVGPLEERYLVAALRSGWVAPVGPDVDAFESEVAERAGVANAVALSSGTAALHLPLVAWQVKPGDVVPTSTMTFAATANAIAYTGAEPFFIDCDIETGNIDVDLLEQALVDLQQRGERIGAIVPVDLLGRAADYGRLSDLARRFGAPLLADGAESFGASHRGRPVGSLADATAISFNGNKIMTTSGGGMLLTDDRDLADRIRYLATQARQPVSHYEHVDIGYNYRLSNLLAAVGRAQLCRLDAMIARRRSLRDAYREVFADVVGVELLGGDDDQEDNHWLTSVVVDDTVTGWTARDLGRHLETHDIETRPLWKPMHLQPVHRERRGVYNGSSARLFERGLTLPSGSSLDAAHANRVCRAIAQFVEARR